MNVTLVRDDFSFEATKTLRSLFDQADFSDVTLVCEDQKQILAHKAILASGSPFFMNIFSMNPHPTPLIYLRVKFSDLNAIVRFLYTGECKVAEDELEGILEIAKNLEIFGISNDEDSRVSKSFNDNDLEDAVNARKISESALLETLHDENPRTSIQKVFDNNISERNNGITLKEETFNLHESKGETKENTEKADDHYCNECKLTFPSDSQLKEHMSNGHMYCCYKIFSSMKSLKCHKQTHNRKKDPDIHYPETEEYLMFFKSGKKEAMAYDKNFYSFGYI